MTLLGQSTFGQIVQSPWITPHAVPSRENPGYAPKYRPPALVPGHCMHAYTITRLDTRSLNLGPYRASSAAFYICNIRIWVLTYRYPCRYTTHWLTDQDLKAWSFQRRSQMNMQELEEYLTNPISLTVLVIWISMQVSLYAFAETYTVEGKKDQSKRQAIVALASNPKTKVERCKYTEGQDTNVGKVVCKTVELGPRGTIRLQK